MKFKNNGPDVQVRIKERSLFGGEGCRWECVRHDEVVELDEEIGLVYGFEKVTGVIDQSKQVKPKTTEGKIGKTKVETKQFNDSDFFNELKSINGIGPKQAKDIVVWGTKEKLIEAIGLGAELPFRDDVEEKLRRVYGKR